GLVVEVGDVGVAGVADEADDLAALHRPAGHERTVVGAAGAIEFGGKVVALTVGREEGAFGRVGDRLLGIEVAVFGAENAVEDAHENAHAAAFVGERIERQGRWGKTEVEVGVNAIVVEAVAGVD